MTFEEWFDKEYPESDFASHMQIIRLSLKEVAHKAWIAGAIAIAGADHQDQFHQALEWKTSRAVHR